MDDLEANQDDFSDLMFFFPDTGSGVSNQATVKMAPGHWVILSFSMNGVSIGASEEPMPDFLLGSIQEFDVAAADLPATPPDTDAILCIGADDFELPEAVAAGSHTIQVINESGEKNGYTFILKLEGDTTVDDILAMFDALFSGDEIDLETAPVVHAVGGLMGYNLGGTFYTTVDLTPGNYAVISSINANEFPYSGFSKTYTVK